MSYHSTITRKGQLTLPKKVRELLHLGLGERVLLEPDTCGTQLKITTVPTIKELKGSFVVKKSLNPVVIRKQMEGHYTR
jgi:AbrB family looped-hinge helix DNA binding protein